MVIYTAFGPDKKPHIYPVPEGVTPASVAETHGLNQCSWYTADDEPAARFAITKDTTGNMDWI